MLNLHSFAWLALGTVAVLAAALGAESALAFIIGLTGGMSLAGSV